MLGGFGHLRLTPSTTRHLRDATLLSLAPRLLLDRPPCNFGGAVLLGAALALSYVAAPPSRVLRPGVLVVRSTAHLAQFKILRSRKFCNESNVTISLRNASHVAR